MCINHDVVSDTMLYLARLYTSDKNCNNLWMYTCMYQQFISDDNVHKKKHNKQNMQHVATCILHECILIWKLGVVMCQQCSQCSRNIWTQNMGSKLLENR